MIPLSRFLFQNSSSFLEAAIREVVLINTIFRFAAELIEFFPMVNQFLALTAMGAREKNVITSMVGAPSDHENPLAFKCPRSTQAHVLQ